MSNIVAVYKILVLIIKALQYFIGAIEKAEFQSAIDDISKGGDQAKDQSRPLPERAEGARRVQEALNRRAK